LVQDKAERKDAGLLRLVPIPALSRLRLSEASQAIRSQSGFEVYLDGIDEWHEPGEEL